MSHDEDTPFQKLASTREAIHRAFYEEENMLQAHLPSLSFSAEEHRTIESLARELSAGLTQTPFWQLSLNELLHHYSFQSPEGLALVNIAEAYLRIPDAETKMRFLFDKLQHADWQTHIKPSNSFMINSIGRVLSYTQRTFAWTQAHQHQSGFRQWISQGVEKAGSYAIEQLIHMIGRSFIMGRHLEEAQRKATKKRPFVFSYDMLGEAALTENDALRNYLRYMQAVVHLGRHRHMHAGHQGRPTDNISIKLSSLFPSYHEYYASRVIPRLLPRVAEICHLAAYYDVDITIDAEESDNVELTMDVITALTEDTSFSQWQGLGCAVQAYQKNALTIIDYLSRLAEKQHKQIKVRLVKGAYWDTEIMQAQSQGLSHFPVFTQKVHTDVNYLLCAQQLMRKRRHLFPRFATHNAITIAYLLTMAKQEGIETLEFQSLYSPAGEQLYKQMLVQHPKHVVRFYAPIGIYPELLPYLVRRIIENGANSSFIQQLLDPKQQQHDLPETSTLLDQTQGRSHPDIIHPQALFSPQWQNAPGINFAWRFDRDKIHNMIDSWSNKEWLARPTHRDHEDSTDIDTTHVYSPANLYTVVGQVESTRLSDIDTALTILHTHQPAWAAHPNQERADCLERIADALQTAAPDLIALCVHEAGKTMPNAWNDWREAIDFCRYYAHCLRVDPLLSQRTPHGVIAAIAPWNFPIAIFTGQIVAALAMGNAVIAKAAEQTQLIAYQIIQCFYQAGVPTEVLAFVTGEGNMGAHIVAHPTVAGVVFTGSNATAHHIASALRQRSPALPLIAETGGLNVMMVDPTALPEKAVKDIMISAFDSAGQRCSALRIVCLQEEIADTIITMLFGAMKEHVIGHPRDIAHHYGPLISQEAKKEIQEYIQQMKDKGFPIRQYGHLDEQYPGHYLLPTVIEVKDLTDVPREVFGPVLHIVRYAYADKDHLINRINDSGYHLTFGFQSRIEADMNDVMRRIAAGNIYINRSTIGAQVCSQPFGGDALSGTGPKAGGPLYLHRFGHITPTEQPMAPPLPYLSEQLLNWGAEYITAEEIQQLRTAYQPWQKQETEQTYRVPSGETNTWYCRPKSPIYLQPCDMLDAIAQMLACAVVSAHARIYTGDCPALSAALPTLPPALRAYFAETPTIPTKAVLLISRQHPAFASHHLLSTQPTDALPTLVVSHPSCALYDPWRLLHEQTVSINTAAIGANTDLMMITNR